MYSGSTEFNNLIEKSGGNAPITRFKFKDFTIEEFTKLEYYGGSNNSDDIAIGTTNMAYLDVSAITDKIITNQEFLFEVGMELSDGTIEYAPMGYFRVQKPDSDEDSVSFKAYDRMQKFEKPYVSRLIYPTISGRVIDELCAICGVVLAKPFPGNIQITDKLEGYTCREVLGYIAGIHGYFACIDRYGKLNLRWYSEIPIEKQVGLIWSLTKAQSDYKVEKITLAKDKETTYTSGTGISGINHSNPYSTQALADDIYARRGNFTYRHCEISMLDDIRLDPWDVLKVTYLDGSVLTIPVMSLEHSFTSGETKVKSVGKTDTENEYNYSGPVTQAMDRMATEILVANRIIATKVDAEWVNAHTVTADKLEATNARVDVLETNSLTVEEADLRYATITNLNAQTARIEDLEATALKADSAIITDLQANKLNTSDLNAEAAKLGYLTANSADLKYANITLGNIDTANIDVANIGLLFTKVGLIDRATIVDGHITGFLDAVEINANKITAGTLIADRILLSGGENGVLYALNNLGKLTSTNVDSLDGYVITPRTINADRIAAGSITANEIDVQNLFAQDITATGTIRGGTFIGGDLFSNVWERDPDTKWTTVGCYFNLKNGWMYAPCIEWTDSSVRMKNLYIEDGFVTTYTRNYDEDGKKYSVKYVLQIDNDGIHELPNINQTVNRTMLLSADGIRIHDGDKNVSFSYSHTSGLRLNNISDFYSEARFHNGIIANTLLVSNATTLQSTLDVTGATTIKNNLTVTGNHSAFGDASSTYYSGCYVQNNFRKGGIHASETKNLGLLDYSNNRYIIYQDADGMNYIPGNLVVTGYIKNTSGNIILGNNNNFLHGTSTANSEYALIGLNNSNYCDIAPGLNNISIGSGSSSIYMKGHVGVTGNTNPTADNKYTLGVASPLRRWKQLVAGTTTISTSDRNLKTDIYELDDKYNAFYDLLVPYSFKFIDGESGRTHIGFMSQDVEEALLQVGLTDLDFAGFCKDVKKKEVINEDNTSEWVDDLDDDGNVQYIYSLRYSEFIALNTNQIQKLKTKTNNLESQVSELKSENDELKSIIQNLSERLTA